MSTKRLVLLLPRWRNRLWPLLLGVLVATMGSWFVGNFSRPLSDGNDTDQYEYVGYYFAKNLSLWPVPQLNLQNNQSFYPYGLNQALLPWGFERDYWYATAYRLFGGAGPYLQYYYVFSLLVTALGAYALLRKRFGWLKATVAGLIVSIFNFYAIYKFPVHLNVCVAHWTALCIIATYCLLRDVLHKRPVSLPFLLVWMLLHVLSLGLELGYVAGFALTFTTLTIPVLGWAIYQQHPVVQQWPALLLAYWRVEWPRNSWLTGGLLAVLLISIWLYVPLTLQIALTAWQFDFAVVPTLPLWSHPARLFIPYLAGFDTMNVPHLRWFRDSFESYGQGSPGMYLTLLAGAGLWQTRRRVALWLPAVLMLLLCLLYHPVLLPTLKLFPWFSFNRHGGRASLVYPVLLVLLALPLRLPRHRPGLLALGLVLLLMLSEWRHGFLLRTHLPTLVVSDDVLRYCTVIRQQPGEAVLDFPFCAVGADGTGMAEGLCPHYDAQNAVFTFRRFYDKKVVGQYFGRLHPDPIQPFLRDGWPRLLRPGYVFTEADWQFLDRFLRTNRFAGINLYPALLTPAQVAQFYQRYGPPVAQARFPAAGRVVFLRLKNQPGN